MALPVLISGGFGPLFLSFVDSDLQIVVDSEQQRVTMSTIVKFGARGLAGLADALCLMGRAFSPACSLALRTRWLPMTTAASCGKA